jgi:DNA repair exonuclease SbcCD ATPase subunit
MRLHALHLREFRCIAELSLQFDEQLTVLTGANGTGKSTVLEAVVWALFGAGSAAVRSEESLRRITAPPDEATAVELHISLHDVMYVIQRRMTFDADAAHVTATLRRSDGELLAATEDAVAESMSKLLGAGREGWLHACVTGRRELQQLAQLRPVDRVRTLARLLGRSPSRRAPMDHVLLEAVRALQQEVAEADDRIAALRTAPDLLVQYTEELERLRPQLAEAESRTDQLQDEWSQKRQDVDTRLLAAQRRAEELQRHIERLSSAGGGGTCPTCNRPLAEHVDDVLGRMDDEYYVLTQDSKWLSQRQTQLARKPPELMEAEGRTARLRSAVDDRTARAARCEQAVQELWTVASERKRAAERLEALRSESAVAASTGDVRPLTAADLEELSTAAAGILNRITEGKYDGIELREDGRIHALRGGAAASVVSGGDEDAIALALRLAIMRALGNPAGVGPLLIDEPFGSMDDGRVALVTAELRELAAVGVQVVLATSHHIDVAGAVHISMFSQDGRAQAR